MKEPSFDRYVALAREPVARGTTGARVVPVARDIPFDSGDPVSAFERIRHGPFAFLLESAPPGGDTWARFTFMGTEPRGAWRLRDGIVEDWEPHRGWHSARQPADPLADFEAILAASTPEDDADLGPFWNGAVGFFGYDIVRLIEKLPRRPKRTSSVPDALFIFTRSVVIIDSVTSKARVVIATRVPAGATDAELRTEFDLAVSEIAELERRLLHPASIRAVEPDRRGQPATGRSSIERDDFIAGVDRIKEYIKAGDCFQALLSRRIELDADFEPASLYRALRALNPSPYMFHLVLDGIDIVGSSPELLVRLENERVTLRPIAGTRPRGSTAARDEELGKELLEDPKELAEHIMLVDLGRNDVGRVARYGTVEVTELMKIEKYSHVLHIVSQVEGELARETSAMDVLRATFPAGTMTGAPKVRAMEIIDELEPVSRGAYAGALGYIAGGGKRMDLAITIRTCVIADGIASVQAGAGIVADSIGETEWEETESKARAVLTAIGHARQPRR